MKSIPKPDLIVFGGAFDPPHLGHTQSICYAQETFPNSQFVVVPGFQTPINSSESKINSALFEHRLEMCKLAFEDFSSFCKILDIEKRLPTPNYTIQTLEYLKKDNPSLEIGLLIGVDQLQNFHLWLKPLGILNIASLIIIPRSHYDFESAFKIFLSSLHLQISLKNQNVYQFEKLKPLFSVQKTPIGVTSTDIRQQIKAQRSFLTPVLSKKVLTYIREQSLYLS